MESIFVQNRRDYRLSKQCSIWTKPVVLQIILSGMYVKFVFLYLCRLVLLYEIMLLHDHAYDAQ